MSIDEPNNNNSLYPGQDFETEDEDSWQISYLDIFTILLGFLFILLALSELNQTKISSVSNLFKSSSNESEFITTPINQIKTELENLLQDEIENDKLEIVRDLNDIRIRFSSDDLYRSGSATLQLEALQLLDNVLAAIKSLRYDDFHIDVEGHSDNTPISTGPYPSNWELSTARASNIVKYFADLGISKQRLKASGYADSRPRAPNEDSLGNPIPKNKDLNRRIVLRLYYTMADRESPTRDTAAQNQQAGLQPSSCRYATQIGRFSSFDKGFGVVQRASKITDFDYEIVRNGNGYSVQTTSNPDFTVAVTQYRTIRNKWSESTPGLMHQCYESLSRSPDPLQYTIQFGAFTVESNAQDLVDTLAKKHQITAQIKTSGSPYYSVITGPYKQAQSALARLKIFKQQDLPNGIYIDHTRGNKNNFSWDKRIQLASFPSMQKATNFSNKMAELLEVKTQVMQLAAPHFQVVTPEMDDIQQAKRLQKNLNDDLPNQDPILHLLVSNK